MLDVEEEGYWCLECGHKGVQYYVHYGSYILRCTGCGEFGPCTSFIAVYSDRGLGDDTSIIEAIELDENLLPVRTIARGCLNEIAGEISRVADEGKYVWLK